MNAGRYATYQQVEMIVHERIGVQAHAKALGHLGEQFQEAEMVGVVPENGLALVAAGGSVKTPAHPFDPQRPCHGTDRIAGSCPCQGLFAPCACGQQRREGGGNC